MASNLIVDVTEADFEFEVLARSQQVPVVVDFWAPWCGPCRILGPLLERLTEEADGEFRLARVNVDENPNLARRYNVRGIPAVKAFVNGQVVAEFVGAQPEPQVRAFLRQIAPSPGDLALEKGQSLLTMEDWEGAKEAFGEVLEDQPDHPAALLGMAKVLLAQGRSEEVAQLLDHFPASREYAAAEKLLPVAKAMNAAARGELDSETFPDTAYVRALQLAARGNIPAAMDGLLGVLRADKHFRNDEARKVMLGLFELLGEDSDLTRSYRRELASILF